MTMTGALIGTPAYMAPEQFRGEAADARSDQFSFCVSLYEALFGKSAGCPAWGRSQSGEPAAEQPRDPRGAARVPPWVRKAVMRGLSAIPAERWPSLSALLDAVQNPASRHRRRALTGAAALLAVAAVVSVGASLASRGRVCAAGPGMLMGVWELPSSATTEPAQQARIRQAFLRTGKGYAREVFVTVSGALTAYARRWATMYRETCEATQVRGNQSAEVLDLRMSCLKERLGGLQALTAVFAEATGEVVANAVNATTALGSLDHCADVTSLRAAIRPPEDPRTRERVEALRTRLAVVRANYEAGRWKAAFEEIDMLENEAEAIGYLPLVAEALMIKGRAQTDAAEAAAEQTLMRAFWAADASKHDDIRARAADALIFVLGYRQLRFREAEQWATAAHSVLRRIGGDELTEAWVMNDLGIVYVAQGRYQEALDALSKAVAAKTKVLGPNHPDVAGSIENEAIALELWGRKTEALARFDQSHTILERALGPDHPRVAISFSDRAELLRQLGRLEEAAAQFGRALEILERELGSNNLPLALALTGIGSIALDAHDPAGARAPLERAFELREAEKLTLGFGPKRRLSWRVRCGDPRAIAAGPFSSRPPRERITRRRRSKTSSRRWKRGSPRTTGREGAGLRDCESPSRRRSSSPVAFSPKQAQLVVAFRVMTAACLDEDTVVAFLKGALSDESRTKLEGHLSSCGSCSEVVTWAAAHIAAPNRTPGREGQPFVGQLAPGTFVDRYQILAPVGRGGMGEVYAAYHPDLDRRVAMKIVFGTGAGAGERRGRLLRKRGPRAPVAPERGDGPRCRHLRRPRLHRDGVRPMAGPSTIGWRPRSGPGGDILNVFLDAGRGLAAAHAAGIVHRDFKPQNVMIGRDGSVRVTDFGLARLVSAVPETAPDEGETASEAGAAVPDRAGITRMTKTGALIGTPAYMAPEQFRGEAADARSDQFSFCVSLYEALFGERPVAHGAGAHEGGSPPPKNRELATRAARVPPWVRKAVMRGLSVTPAERWPSVSALLDALQKDPASRHRRWAVTGAAALLAVGAIVAAGSSLAGRGKVCAGGPGMLTGIWELPSAGTTEPVPQARVRQAFFRTGKGYAREVFATVSDGLTAYARRWAAMYQETCEATHVRGDQSAEVLDLRMSCRKNAWAACTRSPKYSPKPPARSSPTPSRPRRLWARSTIAPT